MRLLLTAFFIETGLVLLLAPWSEFWDRNYFAQGMPFVHALMINNFVRGAVSGLGVVNVAAALGEMLDFLSERRISDHIVTLNQRPAAEE